MHLLHQQIVHPFDNKKPLLNWRSNLKHLLLLLLYCFTVSSTEGMTATCTAVFELSKPDNC